MKRILTTIAILFTLGTLLPSCKMRPQDAERLKAEADAGNIRSMEMLVVYGDTLLSQKERDGYMKTLVDAGNFRALSGRYSEEYFKSGKLTEKQWKAMYMRWMEKGARKGNPDCMYRLADQYLQKEHLDTAKAWFWMRQAADSCQASACTELRRHEGKENVLDCPRFAFRQMWNYNARGQSFLNRASNATFHFMSECLRNSFRSLFGPMWWQSLALMAVMVLVLIGGIIYALSRRGAEAASVAVSGIYGWLNGFTLFTFAKGKSAIPGIITSTDAIGQFSQQPATYGLISDICVRATWVWLIVVALCYLLGLLGLARRGRLNVFTFLKYTLGTVLISVFFYLLGGALSTVSRLLGVFFLIMVLGLFAGNVKPYTKEELEQMDREYREKRSREDERVRQKEREEWRKKINNG